MLDYVMGCMLVILSASSLLLPALRPLHVMQRITEFSFITTLALTSNRVGQEEKITMYLSLLEKVAFDRQLLKHDAFFHLLYSTIELHYKDHVDYMNLVNMTMEFQNNFHYELRLYDIHREHAVCSIPIVRNALRSLSITS